jgi:hypothetical protein
VFSIRRLFGGSHSWRLDGSRLIFRHNGKNFFWEMPKGYKMPSRPILSLAEFLLLSPYGIDVPLRKGRHKGAGRVAVAFSGGVDSTAALKLLPNPLAIYTQVARPRGSHRIENALLAVQEVGGISIISNCDELPLMYGKKQGCRGFGGWTLASVLLSEHFGIRYVADGNIIDFMYLCGPGGHGTAYNPCSFAASLLPFKKVGLEYCAPCSGLSEVSTTRIAGQARYAMGCMRGTNGTPCYNCMKCFRKEALKGNPIAPCKQADTILSRDPIPVLATLLWARDNKGLRHPRLDGIEKDISWIECWYPKSIELIPYELRAHFLERIAAYGIQHLEDEKSLRDWDAHVSRPRLGTPHQLT